MAKTTGIASIAEGRSDLHMVSPYKLVIRDGWNIREPSEELTAHIDMLAQSIAEVGVKEPLTVYWEDGKAYITDGHCRHAAAIRAIEHYKSELKAVPVKTEARYSNEADRVLSQVVRNAGKPLTPFEKGGVFKRLVDLGWKQQDIAKKVGLSPARVSQCLELQSMPAELKALVIAGKVSASMALQLLKEHDGNLKAVLEKLAEMVATAEGEGRKRAMPKDDSEGGKVKEKGVSLKSVVKDAFEFSDIDDSGAEFVIIQMPVEKFEILREMLKL